MRIVFHAWRDLDHPQAGGSERLVDWLASGLAARGHDVVLCAGGPVGQRTYRVEAAGGRFDHYLRMPFVHRRAARDADVVVDVASGMTYFSPWWQSRPTVLLHTHVHTEQWEAMFPKPIAWVGQRIESDLIPRAYSDSTVVTISASSADGLEQLGVDRSHIEVLPVPVEGTPRDDPRSAEPLFVCVGRLVPYKGVDRLLDLWRRVEAEVGGTLVVVGDGPELQELRSRAGRGVKFVGYVSDDEREHWQRMAWLQVHAAAHEGWGIVIAEAGLQGTPTLAFSVPGVRDAIIDEVSGVLVDDDDSFVREWVALTRSPERREGLGTGARLFAASHTVETAVDDFERILIESAREPLVAPVGGRMRGRLITTERL